MRAKINQEGNKLDITIKGNTFTKYINKCILCGRETIDDINKGDKHICDHCYMVFEKNKVKSAPQTKEVASVSIGFVKDENKEKDNNTGRIINARTNTIMSVINNYKPSVKVVNLVDYQNLMYKNGVELNPKTITMIIDLVIKGVNSANKIAKHLGITSEKTINSLRTYMRRLERFAMIVKNKRMTNEHINDNIFTVHRSLVYTQC